MQQDDSLELSFLNNVFNLRNVEKLFSSDAVDTMSTPNIFSS